MNRAPRSCSKEGGLSSDAAEMNDERGLRNSDEDICGPKAVHEAHLESEVRQAASGQADQEVFVIPDEIFERMMQAGQLQLASCEPASSSSRPASAVYEVSDALFQELVEGEAPLEQLHGRQDRPCVPRHAEGPVAEERDKVDANGVSVKDGENELGQGGHAWPAKRDTRTRPQPAEMEVAEYVGTTERLAAGSSLHSARMLRELRGASGEAAPLRVVRGVEGGLVFDGSSDRPGAPLTPTAPAAARAVGAAWDGAALPYTVRVPPGGAGGFVRRRS